MFHAVSSLQPMPRNDPTDTGGLFIGRRPGTGPLHYRGDPERGGPGRRRADGALAAAVLGLQALACLSLWGPQPLAWLWVGSQVNYQTGSVTAGIVVAFAGHDRDADADAGRCARGSIACGGSCAAPPATSSATARWCGSSLPPRSSRARCSPSGS